MIHHLRKLAFARVLVAALGVLCLLLAICTQGVTGAADTTTHDPWDKAQIIMPEAFAKVIASPQGKKPLVVYVGFDFLYKSGHIPGAQFFGEGREAKGIEALKKWGGGIAHDQEVIIYCGCCPLKDCPNIRPAFEALRQAGLMQVKVLYLEDGYAKNWLEKGYPSEKSPAK